jgi:hypothetical protein
LSNAPNIGPNAQQAADRAKQFASELPWNQTDVEKLGPCIMKWQEDHEPFYKRWSETWYNNFQFIYGNQSVRWSRRYGYAVDIDFLQRLPALNQRAQTNIARIVVEALSAMIYANLPEWDVEASDESSIKGKRMKRIIQKILDAYMIRLCGDDVISNAARIYTTFGQFALKLDWNQMGGHQIEVPKWQKNRAPVMTDWMAPNQATFGLLDIPTQATDAQGQPLFEERWEPVLDQMGKQIIDKFFAGDVRMQALTPFQYKRRVDSTGMYDTGSVDEIRLLDYDKYLDEYGQTPGRTKFYDQVQPVYTNPAIYRLAVRHFMRMQFTTPPGLNELYDRPENVYKSALFKNKVLVIERYDAPHPIKWPLGRRTIVCNGEATHVTVPQYNTGKLDGWHPYVEGQWLAIAPSSMSMGPMNDVVQKNRELNIADSLIATALRRNMGSQLLVTPGKGFDPQRFTGEPGLIHEVLDVYGARWLHDDMPLPSVLPALRQSYKDDVYDVSGAGDALRGERSPGAPSGYAQRIIEEREERRLAPARKTFEKAIAGGAEKLICCLKSNVVQLDKNVMGYLMRAAAGDFTQSDVIAFLSTPLTYGVEINIEADSMHLRSKATQQATVNDMASGNPAVQQRLQQNPKALDEYLKFFDAQVLRDESSGHRDRAQQENEQFMDLMRLGPQGAQGGMPTVITADIDQIHIEEHTDFLIQNASEIMRNPAFFKTVQDHINHHVLAMQEKAKTLPPGTSLATPQLEAQSGAQPPPNVQTIFAQKQQMNQQAAAAQQQAAAQQPARQGASGAPKAPTGPAKPGMMGSGGPPQQGTQTPAANMQAANKPGTPK